MGGELRHLFPEVGGPGRVGKPWGWDPDGGNWSSVGGGRRLVARKSIEPGPYFGEIVGAQVSQLCQDFRFAHIVGL